MKLEAILNGIGRTLLTGVFCGLVSTCAPITNQIPNKVNVVLETDQTGMIKGKTVIPKVENNSIVWYGKNGIDVEVEGTNFKTTSISGGAYAIDGIPTGSYNVSAHGGWESYENSGYISNPEPAIVTRQGVAEVPDLKMIPGNSSNQKILYGKVYSNKEKTTPFIGKLAAYNLAYQLDDYGKFTIIVFGSSLGSTTTSSDGSYALQTNMGNVLLKAGSSKTKFFADENHNMNYIFTEVNGIKQADCFLSDY
ncbi:MAG: hypothetical protein AABW47_00975 [Nanoarchaeota archaeon]|mgnify:CR=1 FL=1